MHQSPDMAASAAPLPAAADEMAMLRAEIQRLKRENRALTIAIGELERVADRDMLTPLYNRRYFLSALHQRIAQVERYGDRVVLMTIDINNLKAVNDSYGHAAGDYLLVDIATRLSAINRDGDVLARVGGDEFGLIMDNIGQSEARQKIRRLRATIESEPCEFGDVAIPVTAAFGLTMVSQGTTAEELLGIADKAMIAAKTRH